MPIVPTEPTEIDKLIELEDRIRRMESGCSGQTGEEGDGGDGIPEPEPPAEEEPEVERDIVLLGSCKKNTLGTVMVPQGAPWPFVSPTVGHLQGYDVEDGVPLRVRFDAQFLWWPRLPNGDPDMNLRVAARSLLFKLPPGWWPLEFEAFEVPVTGGAGHIEIDRNRGHVYFVPRYPQRPTVVDLTNIEYAGGGGRLYQGDGSLDPTGGGCGAAWDDAGNTPEMVEGGGAGGGTEWADLMTLAAGVTNVDAQWRETACGIQLRGSVIAAAQVELVTQIRDGTTPRGTVVVATSNEPPSSYGLVQLVFNSLTADNGMLDIQLTNDALGGERIYFDNVLLDPVERTGPLGGGGGGDS